MKDQHDHRPRRITTGRRECCAVIALGSPRTAAPVAAIARLETGVDVAFGIAVVA